MGPDPHPITPASHPLSHPHQLPANKPAPPVIINSFRPFINNAPHPFSSRLSPASCQTKVPRCSEHKHTYSFCFASAASQTTPQFPSLSLPTRPPNDEPSPHLDRTQFNASHHDWVDITTCGPQSRSIGLPTAPDNLIRLLLEPDSLQPALAPSFRSPIRPRLLNGFQSGPSGSQTPARHPHRPLAGPELARFPTEKSEPLWQHPESPPRVYYHVDDREGGRVEAQRKAVR
jgi:hypothetical protein